MTQDDAPPAYSDDLEFIRAERYYSPKRIQGILERMPHGLFRIPLGDRDKHANIKRQRNVTTSISPQRSRRAPTRQSQKRSRSRRITAAPPSRADDTDRTTS